jgi:uncharacterized membrane protein
MLCYAAPLGSNRLSVLGRIFNFSFPFIILACAVVVIYGAVKQFVPSNSSSTNGALKIIKERLAKGEISREKYEQVKKTLRG